MFLGAFFKRSFIFGAFLFPVFWEGYLGLLVTVLVMFFGNVYEVADRCAG